MDRVSIAITQGQTKPIALDTPWNLTGHQIASQLRDGDGTGELIADLETSLTLNTNTGLQGRIIVTVSATVSAGLAVTEEDDPAYAFDVKLTNPSGAVTYSPRLWLSVNPRTTR